VIPEGGAFVSSQAQVSAAAEWRANWRVVLASFVGMGLGSVPLYAPGVFIGAFEQEFGWTRAAISGGVMIYAVAGTILGPFIGALIDRTGPRRIGMIGVVVVPSMLALLSRAGPSIWSWWALWCGLSFGLLFMKPMIWTMGVSSLFSVGRGLALAVMLCGTALASSLTPLLCNLLLERYGWRIAFIGLGGFWAVLAIPLVFAFFSSAHDQRRRSRSPAGPGPAPLSGVSAREGLLSLKFAKLAAAGGVMAFTTTTLSLNLVPLLIWTGQTRDAAAGLAATIGVSAIIGRLSAGYLLDRFNANLVGGASLPCRSPPACCS
jgi:MFS family permease